MVIEIGLNDVDRGDVVVDFGLNVLGPYGQGVFGVVVLRVRSQKLASGRPIKEDFLFLRCFHSKFG